MGGRAINFASGPATLPEEVLSQAQRAIWNLDGSGVGLLETGHRSAAFDRVMEGTLEALRRAAQVPSTHEILLLPGGAQQQFALLPLNALSAGEIADHIDTGTWPTKAYADAERAAKLCGAHAHLAWSGREHNYLQLPTSAQLHPAADARYLLYCSNNTIEGTQWSAPPPASAPLACDATSDLLTRPWPVNLHAVIFAGTQKNLGMSGLSILIMQRNFLQSLRDDLPAMLCWRRHAEAGSRLNTPPTMAIWLAGAMAQWILERGGTSQIDAECRAKAALLYQAIDTSGGFYQAPVASEARSRVTVVFRCHSAAQDRDFVAAAAEAGMVGIEGHKSAGGLRAALYAALPLTAAERLASFMDEFRRR